MKTLEELKRKLEGDKPKDKVVPISEILPAVIPEKLVKKKGKKRGQPTKMTPDNLRRIEEVASLGGNVEDMATRCDIHQDTIYNYFKEHPEYSEKIDRLRGKPILKALNTTVSALNEVGAAHWYLERKRKSEFGPKVEVDLTTKVLQIDL